MICVVLAGGRGERLLPITKKIPKSLISINGLILIDNIFEIVYQKFSKIIVVVDYLREQIINHISNSIYSDKIVIVNQDPQMKGTMGALLSAKKLIEGDFLVICSDNYYSIDDLNNLIQSSNSILIKRVSRKTKFDKYKDAKLSLIENSEAVYLEAGAWYLEEDFLNSLPVIVNETNEYGIPHTIYVDYLVNPSKYNLIFASSWFPVGTHWELEQMRANFRKL